MDTLEESTPAKRSCIWKNEDEMKMIECIREFQLPQRFPSKRIMNTVTGNEKNERNRANIKNSLTSALVIPEISSVEHRIPYKLQKLRILAPDGRDLGEFNLELRADDLLKRHKIIISKSHNFKPVEKQVTISLSSHVSKKIFPRILRRNTKRNTKYSLVNKIFCDNISEANKIKTLQQLEQQQKQKHILPIHEMLMYNQDAEASKQICNNNINKISVSANAAKIFKYQTADSNNRNVVYNVTNNVKNSLKIQEITTEDNKNFSNTNIVSENCNSLLPIVSHKDFTIKCNDSNYLKMPATYSKGKCIATIKNTEHGKIITSLTAVNFAQNCSKTNKNCSVNHLDLNNKNNLNYQEVSTNRNNLLQDKSDLTSKNNEIYEMKLQKNIMTVIPNSDNLPKLNIALTQERNTIVSSVSDKCAANVNHNKITCSEMCNNIRSKHALKETYENDDTYLRDALCNCATVQYSSNVQKTVNIDANVPLNTQRNKEHSKDLPEKDLLGRLSIIKKAMNSVKDNELRELALQALADCGIGIERYVPIQPLHKYKTVHDTQVQTTIFSLLDSKSFVSINKDIEGIDRINHITLHDIPDGYNLFKLSNNVHSHNNSASKSSDVIEQENDFDIDNLINQIYEENSILNMKDTLSIRNMKCRRIMEQLEKDFERAKQYDQNGNLNIHNAILSNNIYFVQRQLVILKLHKENIDIVTENGETSLELAIKYDVRSEIVNLLLEAGAEPVLPKHTHESALIIASKQSSPLLPVLISRVSNSKSLDQVDSEGFTALHYCSMHGNLQGVKALLSAGVTIDLKDMKSGRTALFHAMDNSHMSVAQALLQAGAIATVPNFAGQTPLLVTEIKGSYKTFFGKRDIT